MIHPYSPSGNTNAAISLETGLEIIRQHSEQLLGRLHADQLYSLLVTSEAGVPSTHTNVNGLPQLRAGDTLQKLHLQREQVTGDTVDNTAIRFSVDTNHPILVDKENERILAHANPAGRLGVISELVRVHSFGLNWEDEEFSAIDAVANGSKEYRPDDINVMPLEMIWSIQRALTGFHNSRNGARNEGTHGSPLVTINFNEKALEELITLEQLGTISA